MTPATEKAKMILFAYVICSLFAIFNFNPRLRDVR